MSDAQAELREQIRKACAEADGFQYEHLEPHDYQRHADAILAVRDREMERMKVLVAASESDGHAVRLAAQYADRAIENGERADRLQERLRLLTDEKVAEVAGPNIDLLCGENKLLRAEMEAARKFAGEMRDFCSPHGVATDYADRLLEAMDRARDSQANVAANNICTEIYRRMERLTALQADPEARQSVVENVRGEILGLQGALGIVLGGTIPGGSADKLAQAYCGEWLARKGAPGC
jgi:hypothetical protein